MIFLIDGSNLIYRAIFTFPNFKNSEGHFTGGIYGFFNILKSYSSKFSSNKFIVVWEGRNSWRKEIYPEYKSQRKDKADEIIEQFKDVVDIMKYTGVLQLRKEGYEADDVIAYLATKLSRDIRIVSGDKDLLQLVEKERNIKILRQDPKQGLVEYDEDTIKQKIGCSKVDIPLYLAMVGDKSDNIEGIKRVGPQTALKILDTHDPLKTLDDLYPSYRDVIRRNLELINLFGPRRITKLDSIDFIINPPNLYTLNQTFWKYEIRAFTAAEVIDCLYDEAFVEKTVDYLLNTQLEKI